MLIEIEKDLNKEFSSLCEWFIDIKLSSHVGDDKKKNFFQKKNPPKLSLSYRDYCLKQLNTVEYLGRYLDYNLNGESMGRRVVENISVKLNFLWRQSNYLIICLGNCYVILLYSHILTMDAHRGVLS